MFALLKEAFRILQKELLHLGYSRGVSPSLKVTAARLALALVDPVVRETELSVRTGRLMTEHRKRTGMPAWQQRVRRSVKTLGGYEREGDGKLFPLFFEAS